MGRILRYIGATAIILAVLAFGLYLLHPGGGRRFSARQNPDMPLSPPLDGAAAIRRLESKALAGDIRAGAAVLTAFETCAERQAKEKRDDGASSRCAQSYKVWLRINAESGDANAAHSLLHVLLSTSRCADAYRARFWLSKLTTQALAPLHAGDSSLVSQRERACH